MVKHIHTVMAQLPDVMREMGVPDEQIWELGPDMDQSGNNNDWTENEQPARGNGQSTKGYWWVDQYGRHQYWDGKPMGHYLHHTASSAYTPYVKNAKGQTKANVFAGLRRGNRLYQSGGGVPTIALASAGPADYSAGANNDELIMDFFANEIRFLGRQTKPDTPGFYGNRHVWNTEVILDGVGSVIDPGMRELLIVYCASISHVLDKNAWIHGGHGQGSNRKIDLRDGRYKDMAETIATMQIDTLVLLEGAQQPSPPITPPNPEEDYMYTEVEYSDGFNSNPTKRAAVAGFQAALKIKGFPDLNSQAADGCDGKFGNGTKAACSKFQASVGLPATGKGDKATRAAAEA